jgi:ribosomal protein S18 acetylase RimI-like enzyme
MGLNLDDFEYQVSIPEGFEVQTISDADMNEGLEALALLEVQGYQDTVDFRLRPELSSLQTTKSFFQRLFSNVRGIFYPDLSFKLLAHKRVCGAIYTFDSRPIAYVADFVISPDFRGQGLGEFLLRYSLLQYKQAGFQQAGLAVTALNQPALNLYEKLGFEINDTFTIGY